MLKSVVENICPRSPPLHFLLDVTAQMVTLNTFNSKPHILGPIDPKSGTSHPQVRKGVHDTPRSGGRWPSAVLPRRALRVAWMFKAYGKKGMEERREGGRKGLLIHKILHDLIIPYDHNSQGLEYLGLCRMFCIPRRKRQGTTLGAYC